MKPRRPCSASGGRESQHCLPAPSSEAEHPLPSHAPTPAPCSATGPWFWRLQPSGQLVSPRPARLHRFWEGLPAQVKVIQAAYARHPDGRILLFSGEWAPGRGWARAGGAPAHRPAPRQAPSSGCSRTGSWRAPRGRSPSWGCRRERRWTPCSRGR